MRWLWILALCACGAEVPPGGVVRNADTAQSARVHEPQDLIPSDLELEGGTFHTQYLFLQQGANLLGQFSSNGLTNRIGVPPRLSIKPS